MPSLLRPASVTRVKRAFRNLEDTIPEIFWETPFAVWRRTRPDGWKVGSVGEGWELIVSDFGDMDQNSSGGPIVGEAPIFQEAPFVLSCWEWTFDAFRVPKVDGQSEHEVSAAWVVVEGMRLFRVVAFLPRGSERQHANAYLAEVFDEPLPEVD